MNGATTLPCVSTMSAPKTTSMITTGSSQYFFRARMKSHNSQRTLITDASELAPHRVRGRPRWPAGDPIRLRRTVDPQAEQILSQQPQHQGHWGHRAVEEQRHDPRSDDALQEQTEPKPGAIARSQKPGPEKGHHREHDRRGDGPGPHRPVPHDRPQGEQSEHGSEGKPERAVGGTCDLLFAREVLVDGRRWLHAVNVRDHGRPTERQVCREYVG